MDSDQKLRSARPIPKQDNDKKLQNQICTYTPPVYRQVRPETPPCDHSVLISPAYQWDVGDVYSWASSHDLPETARTAFYHRIDGRRLMGLDALKLQRLGVSNGHEALRAEGALCRLSNMDVDEMAMSSNPLDVKMHRALRSDQVLCEETDPLSTLSTDPWRENLVRTRDKQDAHERWLWYGCTDDDGMCRPICPSFNTLF